MINRFTHLYAINSMNIMSNKICFISLHNLWFKNKWYAFLYFGYFIVWFVMKYTFLDKLVPYWYTIYVYTLHIPYSKLIFDLLHLIFFLLFSSIYNVGDGAISCSIKEPDLCSVFISELIAINKAFDYSL